MKRDLSLSTVVCLMIAGLALSVIVVLFPWSHLPLDFSVERLTWTRADTLLRATLLLWVVAAFFVLKLGAFQAAKQKLRHSSVVGLNEMNLSPSARARLEQLRSFANVEFRVLGRRDTVADHGGCIESTPVAIHMRERRSVRNIVLIPAIYFRRFSGDPDAWEALLTHELAHFENRDSLLLFEGRRLLMAFCVTAPVCVFVSIAASVWADAGTLQSGAATWAAIVGKNFMLTAIALVLIALLLIKRMETWREALADVFVANACGLESLQRAGMLTQEASEPATLDMNVDGRPTPERRRLAYVLSAFDVCMLGFLTGALADYAVGPFAYMKTFVQMTAVREHLFASIIAVLGPAISFVAFYLALVIVSRNSTSLTGWPFRKWALAALLLISGYVAGHFLLQVVPLAVTSCAMPSGFDNVERHDVQPLIFGAITTTAISGAAKVFLALIAAAIERLTGRLWSGLGVGLAWCLLNAAEEHYAPQLCSGFFAFGATILLVALLVLCCRDSRPIARPGWKDAVWFFPILLLLLLGALRWGEPGHFAACASQAGVRAQNAGDMKSVINYLKRAASLAPHHAQAWIDLARVFATTSRLTEAAIAAERGLHSRYLSSWTERFRVLALCGDLRLQMRGPGDLRLSQSHYRAAEELWRQNSRIPGAEVSHVLYNCACAMSLLPAPDDFEVSIRIFEAARLDPQLAVLALDDSDLAWLQLRNRARPAPETLHTLAALGLTNFPRLRRAVETGQVNRAEATQFIVDAIRRTAATASEPKGTK